MLQRKMQGRYSQAYMPMAGRYYVVEFDTQKGKAYKFCRE